LGEIAFTTEVDVSPSDDRTFFEGFEQFFLFGFIGFG
jgi:hypothetical protein